MRAIHAVAYYSAMKKNEGTSLSVQRLGLYLLNSGCVGSIPGWGTWIPHFSRSKGQENQDSVVTNPIKTLKMVHIQKKKKSLQEKRNEVLTHVTTWGNLGSMMVREKSCHQRQRILRIHLSDVRNRPVQVTGC